MLNIDHQARAIQEIRERADAIEEVTGPDSALGMRWAADEFETSLWDSRNEALTPTEAAQECHWAASTIAKKIRDGELPQAGKSGEPRVRREDLFVTLSETQLTELIGDVLSDALD